MYLHAKSCSVLDQLFRPLLPRSYLPNQIAYLSNTVRGFEGKFCGVLLDVLKNASYLAPSKSQNSFKKWNADLLWITLGVTKDFQSTNLAPGFAHVICANDTCLCLSTIHSGPLLSVKSILRVFGDGKAGSTSKTHLLGQEGTDMEEGANEER